MAEQTLTTPTFDSFKLNEKMFTQLMTEVEKHIHKEYAQQRITSADYSRVYLGSLESVLANSTQFLLGGLLLEQQKAKIEAEIKLIELEGEKLRFEIDFMYPAQLIKLEQEGKLIEAQVRLAEAQILKTAAEILKIEAEIALLVLQEALIAAQIRKIDKEIEFLTAKIETEKANVTKNFSTDSVIGRQTALLRAQQLGFAGELELKVNKLNADYAAVYESVNELGVDALDSNADGTSASIIAQQIADIL